MSQTYHWNMIGGFLTLLGPLEAIRTLGTADDESKQPYLPKGKMNVGMGCDPSLPGVYVVNFVGLSLGIL